MSGGDSHICARLENGLVYCWGANGSGVSGTNVPGITTAPSTPVVGVVGATDLQCRGSSCCAVLARGELACWGDDRWGQLGTGTPGAPKKSVRVATKVPGLRGVKTVSLAREHTCALLNDGKVKCWGLNAKGQLGDGTTDARTAPTLVTALTEPVAQLAAGVEATCVRGASGKVFCWGSNQWQRLDQPETVAISAVPVELSRLGVVTDLTAGDSHFCAVVAHDSVKCWGFGERGQLGGGVAKSSRGAFVSVGGVSNVVSVSGGTNHTCALRDDGQLYCWGDREYNQLGKEAHDDFGLSVPVAMLVPVLHDARATFTRGDGQCAVRASGLALCWGMNRVGELSGVRGQQFLPRAFPEISASAASDAPVDRRSVVVP